ncbi:alpha/beta fold hydrolase [Streptomyces sp. NPDC056670]|uniref:alpha/beta fold hydrolase n=1 Tax=Streptomyces sp. NPDC056670 TaxID=3345904 RepID=UPI003675D858
MPTFTSHDGTELAYRVTGEGSLLVCLPGGPVGAARAPGEPGGLAAHRRLVLLAPRGAGDATAPGGPDTDRCGLEVADVESLRAHLGLDRIDLLGDRASEDLALLYAARHPDRVASLTLVASGVRAPGGDLGGVATAALAKLTAPVLVLTGAHEGGSAPKSAADLAALFPDAELAVQPGAGHHPWTDDAEAFARTVAAFLDPDVHAVVVDGVRLAYRVRGSEAAPPVILVHGRGGDSRDWDPIAERLAATRRVYALDLRGHGLSDWPGGYSFEAFRDDLHGFITELGLAGADLVGHSMGGAAAALLAQEAPGLLGRLVLEETPPLFPLDPPRGAVERPEGPLGFDWPVIEAVNAQLNDPDPAWRGRFAAIATPTLVVAGGPASRIDQKKLAWMASRIPDARLVTIDAGHLVHTDRPDQFLSALREFGIG